MLPAAYGALLKIARRASRRPDEAEDLVQDALLEAVGLGRTDFSAISTQRWLAGIVRNKAAMAARTAARSRRRDAGWQASNDQRNDPRDSPPVADILSGLPPAEKVVAALVLTGHNRREIAYLLGLTDAALRQRLSGLKRRLRLRGVPMPADMAGLDLAVSYGRIRDALLPALLHEGGAFASHDPDGHAFIVRRSQTGAPRQQQAQPARTDP